jgi:hypothetical protein
VNRYVQFVDQRDAGGDVQACDGFVADAVEVLDQGAQRVAVRGDQDRLAGLEIFLDVRLPVGQEPHQDILQAFSARQGLAEVRIPGVVGLGELGVVVEGRRRGVVGAAPFHELLFAVFGQCLGLVLALQCAVVAFVEAPVALDRDPAAVGLVQGDVRGVDGPLQQGGVEHVREDVVLHQQLTAAGCFRAALVVQVNVHPAGEEVLGVPFAVAVAQQNQLVSHDFHPSRAVLPPAQRYKASCRAPVSPGGGDRVVRWFKRLNG